jgi:ERCC4-type nuclease
VLTIDSREQAPQRAIFLAAMPSFVKATVEKLASADFRIVDKCQHVAGLERKAAGDLLNSLRTEDGKVRLHDQLGRMARTYDYCMLVVETGQLKHNPLDHKTIADGRMTGWRYGSVLAQIESIEADGVVVIPTSDIHGTAEWVATLCRRAKRGCVVPAALRKDLKAAA